MLMQDKNAFIIASANLARQAPNAWEKFLSEFRKYADRQMRECVSASVDRVLVAQGNAQQAMHLLRLLESAVTSADRITDRNRDKGSL